MFGVFQLLLLSILSIVPPGGLAFATTGTAPPSSTCANAVGRMQTHPSDSDYYYKSMRTGNETALLLLRTRWPWEKLWRLPDLVVASASFDGDVEKKLGAFMLGERGFFWNYKAKMLTAFAVRGTDETRRAVFIVNEGPHLSPPFAVPLDANAPETSLFVAGTPLDLSAFSKPPETTDFAFYVLQKRPNGGVESFIRIDQKAYRDSPMDESGRDSRRDGRAVRVVEDSPPYTVVPVPLNEVFTLGSSVVTVELSIDGAVAIAEVMGSYVRFHIIEGARVMTTETLDLAERISTVSASTTVAFGGEIESRQDGGFVVEVPSGVHYLSFKDGHVDSHEKYRERPVGR